MSITRLNAREEFDRLVQRNVSDWTVVAVYASLAKGENIPAYQKLSMSREVGSRFREIATGTLAMLRDGSSSGDLELLRYTEATTPHQHQVEYLQLDGTDFVGSQIAHLNDIDEIAAFEADERFMKGLRFYCIVLQPPAGCSDGALPILFFRKYSNAYRLGQRRFAIRWSREHFDLISEPTYLFDDRVDCIISGDIAFVLRKSDFRQIFQFYAMLETVADKALGEIRKSIAIEGADAFEEVCKRHPYRLGLLRDISRKSYLSRLTPEILRKTIEEEGIPVVMSGEGDNAQLVFDPAEPWAILRLLNDCYLQSSMTGEHYLADSKQERSIR